MIVNATSWSLRSFCSAARSVPTPKRSSASGSVEEKKTSTGWPRSRSGFTTRRANEQCVRLNARGEPASSTATRAVEGRASQCPTTSEWNRKRLVTLAMPAAAKNATIDATATRTTAFLRFNAVAATCARLPTARERVWCESLCSLSSARGTPAISMSPEELSTERRRGAAPPAGLVAAIEAVETGRDAACRPVPSEATHAPTSGPDRRRRGVRAPLAARCARATSGRTFLRARVADCGDEPARRSRLIRGSSSSAKRSHSFTFDVFSRSRNFKNAL